MTPPPFYHPFFLIDPWIFRLKTTYPSFSSSIFPSWIEPKTVASFALLVRGSIHSETFNPQTARYRPNPATSGGQISTKHQKTSTKPFFATCRLPQYPGFWKCVETGTLFLGPHWKRSLKGLDNLLTVTTPNTQLLPRPRKISLSS